MLNFIIETVIGGESLYELLFCCDQVSGKKLLKAEEFVLMRTDDSRRVQLVTLDLLPENRDL